MNKFKSFFLIVSVFIFGMGTYISFNNMKEKNNSTVKPTVVTSNFALYDLVKHIAADKFEVYNILPFGIDPHSFEPTPKELAKIEKSALFFYSGNELEPWVEKFSVHVKSIDLSKYVTLLKTEDDEDEKEKEEHHHHGAYDPHYWLDFQNMQKIAQVIAKQLAALEPNKAKVFKEQSKKYIQMLQALDKRYRQVLSQCKKETIIVSHNAFNYLAKRYGFHVDSLSGLSSESHTNAKKLQQILKEVQNKGINVVFFEDFSNHKEIEVVANELSTVHVDRLQPLANITREDALLHRDYEMLMLLNLKKISEALQCR